MFVRSGIAAAGLFLIALPICSAADSDYKLKINGLKEYSKQGSGAIPKIAPYLSDTDVNVRLEAVKAIVVIGTQHSLRPLVQAAGDNDSEIQIRATDGLVNFYLPGYVQHGLTASIRRAGSAIKSKFIDSGEDIVDPYIARQVRSDVVQALGRLARGGSSMDSRANAARAVGILRGRGAIPDLEQALKSKDNEVIYESLVALRKIGDPAAGPSVAFRLRDPVERVQIAAIETTGLLQNRAATAQLRDVFEHARNAKIQRAALSALAMMPDAQSRAMFVTYLRSKDDDLRAASAEGLARAANPEDKAVLEKAFQDDVKTAPRLADAFALVKFGNQDMSEFAPLRYLVNSLNSKAYRGVAQPYLSELAHDPAVRKALYPALNQPAATRDEKTGLAQVFANSGDRDSMPYLEALSKDTDDEISRTGMKALQTLQSRL